MSIHKEAEELEKKLEAPRITEQDRGMLCREFADKHNLVFQGFRPASGSPIFSGDVPEKEDSLESQLSELDGKTLEEL